MDMLHMDMAARCRRQRPRPRRFPPGLSHAVEMEQEEAVRYSLSSS